MNTMSMSERDFLRDVFNGKRGGTAIGQLIERVPLNLDHNGGVLWFRHWYTGKGIQILWNMDMRRPVWRHAYITLTSHGAPREYNTSIATFIPGKPWRDNYAYHIAVNLVDCKPNARTRRRVPVGTGHKYAFDILWDGTVELVCGTLTGSKYTPACDLWRELRWPKPHKPRETVETIDWNDVQYVHVNDEWYPVGPAHGDDAHGADVYRRNLYSYENPWRTSE